MVHEYITIFTNFDTMAFNNHQGRAQNLTNQIQHFKKDGSVQPALFEALKNISFMFRDSVSTFAFLLCFTLLVILLSLLFS